MARIVEAGDVLARASREAAKTRDITGGLPRVAELFEARMPKDNSIIAKISGRIEFVRDYKAKRKIAIIPEEGDPVEYLIPKTKVIDVQEGDWVKKGDNLISGSPNPHDILEVLGVEALAEYLVAEIQEVYRLQGVKINDKHIEVIVRQMLQKVEITDGGDTTLLPAEQVDREEMDEYNAKLAAGQAPAVGKPVLLGHHQGLAPDAFVHLGRFVPGNHPRAHAGGGRRQEGHADRSEGKRHRRPSDPGRYRRGHEPSARRRLQPRRGAACPVSQAAGGPDRSRQRGRRACRRTGAGSRSRTAHDPLAEVEGETHGTDADAGEYLNPKARKAKNKPPPAEGDKQRPRRSDPAGLLFGETECELGKKFLRTRPSPDPPSVIATGSSQNLKKPSPKSLRRADWRRRKLMAYEAYRKSKRRAIRLNREIGLLQRLKIAKQNGILFDTNLERRPVILPNNFSLSTNYGETVGAIQMMREMAFTDFCPIMLHFEHVTHIEPAAALALVAEIHRIRSLRGVKAITGTYPRRRDVYLSLCDMGFFSLLNIAERSDVPRQVDDRDGPIFLRFLSDNRVYAELIDRFVSILENNIMAMNALARERLVAAIGEAMANSLDHAYPDPQPDFTMPNRWWMSSWVSSADREVSIAFFDQGVGIPNTLDPNAYESIRAALANISHLRLSARPSDGEIIMAATEYHRSGTGSSGRGRGFADMKRFVDVCRDGELRVLSYRGSYHYIRGKEAFGNEALSLGGTLIEWRFRHDGRLELSDG